MGRGGGEQCRVPPNSLISIACSPRVLVPITGGGLKYLIITSDWMARLSLSS